MTIDCLNCIPHRYLVIIFVCVMMLVSTGYRTCFALMATEIAVFNLTSNMTTSGDKSIFPHCTAANSKSVDWGGSTVSLLHTAYFAGQFVMSVPSGALVMRFSPKNVFGITLLASSILQILLPVATNVHVALTFVIRAIQGMLEASSVPSMNAVISAWASKHEKARFMNYAYAGVYLSPAAAMFVTGATTCYISWDSVMYIYGSIGIAWLLLWMLLIASSPEKHQQQRNTIAASTNKVLKQSVPWCKLFTSLPLLAIWVAAFCRNFMFALLVTEVQQYYKDVYNLSASMNGLLSGLPQVFMVVFMLGGACVFDTLVKRGILSVTNSRKLAQCSGYGIQGVCTIAIGFIDDYFIAFALLSVGAAFSGFAVSGYQTNVLDLAPKYTGPLTGIYRTGMLGSVISTSLASVLTGESHSLIDWQHMFIITGSVHIAGVIIYGIFASGNIQSWAQDTTENTVPATNSQDISTIYDTTNETTSKIIPSVEYTSQSTNDLYSHTNSNGVTKNDRYTVINGDSSVANSKPSHDIHIDSVSKPEAFPESSTYL